MVHVNNERHTKPQSKAVLVPVIRVYEGMEVKLHLTNLSTRWRQMISFMLCPPFPSAEVHLEALCVP